MNLPIAYTIPSAVAASGVSRTTLYRAIKAKELVAKKRGRRTLILAADLFQWLTTLPNAVTKADNHGQ